MHGLHANKTMNDMGSIRTNA